ncbi:glutathione S-transferase family protein [Bradyrhizobium sp. URHD0069]|uniref:glutathione S-transferase family protein n=1 Tax=Bradyrhizobium sp. URHD0069 TaxID=1380355 RepID=UPI00049652BD|nr:glutathione S-transferase N-terminal domain-containing protein [Bradyrhizobium sp. URHD0069]
MKLLGRSDSLNVRKVLWAMDELGLEASREDYGGPFGKTDTLEYRQMNPTGLVPVLVDGDTKIWESNTIIRYLAGRVPEKEFAGRDHSSAAKVSQWMDWQLGTLNPLLQTLFAQTRLGDKRDERIVVDTTTNLNKLFKTVLANALPPKNFMFGSAMSAADVCLGVMLHRHVSLLNADSLDDRVRRYHEELAGRGGFKRHVAIGKP